MSGRLPCHLGCTACESAPNHQLCGDFRSRSRARRTDRRKRDDGARLIATDQVRDGGGIEPRADFTVRVIVAEVLVPGSDAVPDVAGWVILWS